MKGRLAWLAIACALACAVPAGGVRAADLLGVVEDTLDHDATLAAARDAYRAAAQAVPKARAGLLPHVEGGWGRQYNRIAMDGFPGVRYWQSGWTVALAQPLFDWTRWSAWRQAGYVVARGRLEAASAGQDAILRAAQAYFDALAAADEVARAGDYLRALDAHLALLARARSAGEATLVDLREAEASCAQAQLQLLDARDRERLARAALERLTGKPVETLAALPEHAAMPALEPADAQAWVTQAQAHGYPVQIRELALQIAKLDTEKARGGHYPRVDVQVAHTPAGASGGYSRPTTTTTALLAVAIPLFSGGETTAQVEEARALEDKARDELEAAARDAAGAAREGWLRTASGRSRIAALEALVQRAQASLEATRIGFVAGSRASTDVLRATDGSYASRRDLIRARYDTVLSVLKLLADAASLDLDEVGRINAQLYRQRANGRLTGNAGLAGAATAGPVSVALPEPALVAARISTSSGPAPVATRISAESGPASVATRMSAAPRPTPVTTRMSVPTAAPRHPASAAEMEPAFPATATPLR